VLVIDANIAVATSFEPNHLSALDAHGPFFAPPLMWSEALSALHEARWRREISPSLADLARSNLNSLSIERRDIDHDAAWHVAEELGVAKTYDAEYLALARLLNCRVVTLDHRLRRGADRLGLVVTPEEL
jgi:predicted nucleic acid-binding protein